MVFVPRRSFSSLPIYYILLCYYNINIISLPFLVRFVVGISCHHIRIMAEKKNMNLHDGVYTINPTGSKAMPAYCDMSRDGGGWTLLVTSHTNSWTSKNVLLRNEGTPQLEDDYSILSRADAIKDNLNVAGESFDFRLEAEKPGW